jgi:nitrite reductase (NO-forming)/hydroxylamine reductase
MFLATHPASSHLWMDTPLSADPAQARQVAVFRKDAPQDGFRQLPVASWAGIGEGPSRVLQPAFSPDGSEVWLVVWNPQNLNSAIVVIDDETLEPKAVIRDPGLITPTRIYSVGALRREGQAQQVSAPERQ